MAGQGISNTVPNAGVAESQLQVEKMDPLAPLYAKLLAFCTYDLQMQELREYLERYGRIVRRDWTGKVFEDVTGPCHLAPELVQAACRQLDELPSVTRYLLSRYALRKRAFLATGIFKLPYPKLLKLHLDDANQKLPIVKALVEGMKYRYEDDGISQFQANVAYTRLPGLALFTIDRYDIAQTSSLVQISIIYAFDAIPMLYVVPFETPIEVIRNAFQSTFRCPLKPERIAAEVKLHFAILQDALHLGLESGRFTEQLQRLLHFKEDTLCHKKREPNLAKYPSVHVCPFDSVVFKSINNFKLVVKAKHNQSILEVLYKKEKNQEIVVSVNTIMDLANGKKNSFFIYGLSSMQVHIIGRTQGEQALGKYPTAPKCPFDSVSLESTEGFKLVVKARLGQNLLRMLCEKEQNQEIIVPRNIIKALEKGKKNVFSSQELFEADTRPQALMKYPPVLTCPFNEVTFQIAEGAELKVKARGGRNVLEVLYEMEKNGEITVSEDIIKQLIDGNGTMFIIRDASYFQYHGPGHVEREPALIKYPAVGFCPFYDVIFQSTADFELMVRVKPGHNLVETLYEKERNQEIFMPKHIIKQLAEGIKNVFSFGELFRDDTISSAEWEPSALKDLSGHSCPFRNITLDLCQGFRLVVTAKRGHNILDVLYQMQQNKRVIVPETIIKSLVDGKRNVFNVQDFCHNNIVAHSN